MQQQASDSHFIFDIISSAVTVGWIVVGLLIRASLGDIRLSQKQDKADLIANQTEVKEELNDKHAKLLESQNQMKEELNAKHAQNQEEIRVHSASDAQQFGAINSALFRIEAKQDKYFNGKS
jgi:hypothetical protein